VQRGYAMRLDDLHGAIHPSRCHLLGSLRRPPAAPTDDWRRSGWVAHWAAWPHQPSGPAQARAGRREPRPMATRRRPLAARDRFKVAKSSAPSFFVQRDNLSTSLSIRRARGLIDIFF
jgi:hypothetical protein